MIWVSRQIIQKCSSIRTVAISQWTSRQWTSGISLVKFSLIPEVPLVKSSWMMSGNPSVRSSWVDVRSSWVDVRSSWVDVRSISTSSFNNQNKGNIILMGSPGSGKTTHGRELSLKLAMPVLDIDDDHLEPYWKMKVSEKLAEIGGDRFIEAEGEALLQFKASNTIISLTGSNPLHPEAMKYIADSGVVVFIDANSEDILNRLEAMKVDRIVGQGTGMTMKEILAYRQQFYEKSYDVRVTCEKYESFESINQKIYEAIRRFQRKIGFVSTRSKKDTSKRSADFTQVVLQGLAQDGGLYVPERPLPSMTVKQWERLVEITYPERALRILEILMHPSDLHPKQLCKMVHAAYSSENFNCNVVTPIVALENNQYILELFHGPSASFKDAALQLMPQLFAKAVETESPNTRYLILVATSGDTGSAVLDGFGKYAGDNTSVIVLYPERGVSTVQKSLMTSAKGKNIKVIGVDGDFDFCQSAIKTIFSDSTKITELSDYDVKLSAANSINWGRLLPQVVYHASGYLNMVQQGLVAMGDEVDLCIPTGNFGNILAAIYAKKMGIPFRRFVCASNKNNVLSEFFQTGMYDLREKTLSVTTSPAIDILKSSNLERYLHMVMDEDGTEVRRCFEQLSKDKFFKVSDKVLEKMQADIIADWCSEDLCSRTIQEVFQRTKYLLDPHTAIAKAVADRLQDNSVPMVICSTAHYGKFASDVLTSVGRSLESNDPVKLFEQLKELKPYPIMHLELQESIQRPRVHEQVLPANVTEIVSEIKHFIRIM